MDNYINITSIIELGDTTERAFFNFLKEKNIEWHQFGSNLNFIMLPNKKEDFIKIFNTWKEVKNA